MAGKWLVYTTPRDEVIQDYYSFPTKTKMLERAKMEGWDLVKDPGVKYTYRFRRPVSMVPKGVPKKIPQSAIKKSRARNRAGKRNAQVAKIKKITKLKQGLKKAGRR